MGIRVGSTVVNCADLDAMTRFWSAALDLVPSSLDPDDDFRRLDGQRVNVSLQRTDTPVTARDQMHLDLYTDDLERQLERLTSLGATVVRQVGEGAEHYVVLTDPEGNEFCLCQKDAI